MIDYFIICHDQDIILSYIKNNKFFCLPNHKFLFVGNKEKNLIENLDNVIICRDLPDNIELYPSLCSFTAWYAVSKNSLTNQDYICLLEYDIDIKNNFHEINLLKIKNKRSIYGYFKQLLHDNIFLKSNPWLDIYVIKNFDCQDAAEFLNKYCSGYKWWCSTTNCLIKKNIFQKFVNWFYKESNLFKNEKLAPYVMERMLNVFIMLNFQNIQFIENLIHHHQKCSHETQDLYGKFIANYGKLLKEYNKELSEAVLRMPIDLDFDGNFYYKKYPDVQNHLLNRTDISFDQKMFHHYFFYGRKEKRHKNRQEANAENFLRGRDNFFLFF